MNPAFLQTVLSGVLVALFSAMIVFIITTAVNRDVQKKILKSKVDEAIDVHNKINHQKSIFAVVKEHEEECDARNELTEVKTCVNTLQTGVLFLVKEAGGNPRDLGLIK